MDGINMAYIKGKRVALSDKPTEESIAFAEYCRELFEYKDGSLVWKVNKGRARVGNIIGDGFTSTDGGNYFLVSIDNVRYKLHQIVFLLHYNYIPKVIDHIDRDRANNRIENLRSASIRENSLNRLNSSETPNICKNSSGYQVSFRFNGLNEYFGTYKTIEEATYIRDKIANDLDNWRTYLPIKPKDKPNRYITKHGNGFRISRKFNYAWHYFGQYPTLEAAIAARDELEANNWNRN